MYAKVILALIITKRNIEKRLAANNHSHIHHTNKHCIDEQRNTYKIDSHNNETERKAALERAFTEHRLLDKNVYMHTHTLRDDHEMKQYSATICMVYIDNRYGGLVFFFLMSF